MNNKKSVSAILLVMLFCFSFTSFVSGFDLKEDLQGEEIPSKAKKLIGDQKINIYVDDVFDVAVNAETNVLETIEQKYEEPSLEVFLSSNTLEKIENSDDSTKAAYDAYDSGEIRLVKYGFFNKIRFGIAGIAAKLYSIVGKVIQKF